MAPESEDDLVRGPTDGAAPDGPASFDLDARRRLAMDIHDGPLQELIAVGMRIEIIERHAENDDQRRECALALQIARDATTHLREIMNDLGGRVPPTEG
jgi:signal transduction histidine kinase